MDVDIERKVLKWGNGFGIRITSTEAREIGLSAGRVARVHIEAAPAGKNDLSTLPVFGFPWEEGDLDEMLENEAWKDHQKSLSVRRGGR